MIQVAVGKIGSQTKGTAVGAVNPRSSYLLEVSKTRLRLAYFDIFCIVSCELSCKSPLKLTAKVPVVAHTLCLGCGVRVPPWEMVPPTCSAFARVLSGI